MKKIGAKKLRELLQEIKIYNDYELLGAKRLKTSVPFISLTSGGRSFSTRWHVVRVGFKTDLNAHWSDNGCKTFIAYGNTAAARNAALAEAQTWAGERYKITEWVKTPYGAWTSGPHLRARLRALLPEIYGETPEAGT